MHVDHVEFTASHEPCQSQRPTGIPTSPTQAVCPHPSGLELTGEMILPGQYVGALDLEPVSIVRPRRGDEQAFGPARTETFHHPQDSDCHVAARYSP